MDDIVALLNDGGRNLLPSERDHGDEGSEVSLGLRVAADGRLVDTFLEAHEKRMSPEEDLEEDRPLPSYEHSQIEEVFSRDETVKSVPQVQAPRQNSSRAQCLYLERKNEELRLRVTGLSRTVRELSEAKSKLAADLEDRDQEIRKCRTRLSAIATTRELGGTSVPPVIISNPISLNADKKRADTLAEALSEARRRERRAIELGSSLRHRVTEERERADALDRNLSELRDLLATADSEAGRHRSALKRALSATQRAKQNATNAEATASKLRATNAKLERELDQAAKNFATKKRQLEQAKLDALAHADHQSKRATAAREECLALRAKIKSLSTASTVPKTKTKRKQQSKSEVKTPDTILTTQAPPPKRLTATTLLRPKEPISFRTDVQPSKPQTLSIWDSDSEEDDDDNYDGLFRRLKHRQMRNDDSSSSSSPPPSPPRRRIPRQQLRAGTAETKNDDDISEKGLSFGSSVPTPTAASRAERLRETFRRVVAVERAIETGLPE